MHITNKANIDEWSAYLDEDIEQFGDEGDATRRELLNPILFELMGDVEGKAVLDAGCGTGYLSRKLAKLGAKVTGVEPAQGMFEYISNREEKEKLGISFLQQDLSLFENHAEAFDIVISNLVFMDIPDYESAMNNCIDSLKSGGVFIFSISHPCFPGSDSQWQRDKQVNIQKYFDSEPEKKHFGHSFSRPLQDYLNLVIDSGCNIVRVVEPQASEKLVKEDSRWERNHYVPQFLIIKAIKK